MQRPRKPAIGRRAGGPGRRSGAGYHVRGAQATVLATAPSRRSPSHLALKLVRAAMAEPAAPVRLAFRGAKHRAAGMACKAIPWSATAARCTTNTTPQMEPAQQRNGASPRRTTRQWMTAHSGRRRPGHRLQLLDHAGFDKDAGLVRRNRNIEHPRKGFALQVRTPTVRCASPGIKRPALDAPPLRCGSHSTSVTKPSSNKVWCSGHRPQPVAVC